MPTANFIVTSLPAYVEENRDLLLKNFGLVGTDTRRRIGLQTGIKKSAYLNYLEVSPTLQDASGCGMEPAGDVTLTQRTITVAQIKVDLDICAKNLIGKYAEYEVATAATDNPLPFEEYLMDGIISGINRKIETMIWQGDKTSGTANLNKFDGMIKLLSAAGSGAISSTKPAGETTKIDAVKRALLAMPAGTLTEDAVIFCGTDFLRDYEQELVAANLFHFEPGMDYDSIRIPGSRVRLIATVGLDGQNYLVAGQLSNFFFGCDLMDDSEKFEVWYSQDNREFRIAVEFNAGVQVAFPGNVVIAAI